MSAIQILKHYLQESFEQFKANAQNYRAPFLGFIVVYCLGAFPWEITNAEYNSTAELVFESVLGFISIVISAVLINTERSVLKNIPRDQLKYVLPAFLITLIYYILIVMFGLVLLIIPGLMALFFFWLAPFVAILNPEASPLKTSLALTKVNPALVFCLLIPSLSTDFIPAVFELIPWWHLKLVIQVLTAYPLAMLNVLILQSSVRVYFHLQDQLTRAE